MSRKATQGYDYDDDGYDDDDYDYDEDDYEYDDDGSGGGGPSTSEKKQHAQKFLQKAKAAEQKVVSTCVRCPVGVIGAIVGRGGTALEQFHSDHAGVSVDVPRRNDKDDSSQQHVEITVSGHVEKKVAAAAHALRTKIESLSNTCEESFSIPSEFVGAIIGKGGVNMNRIRASAENARINIAADKGDPTQTNIVVVGTRRGCAIAKRMIGEATTTAASAGSFETTVDVWEGAVGQVIGPKGACIKQLQSEFHVVARYDKGEEHFHISGSTEKEVNAAAAKVRQLATEPVEIRGGNPRPKRAKNKTKKTPDS